MKTHDVYSADRFEFRLDTDDHGGGTQWIYFLSSDGALNCHSNPPKPISFQGHRNRLTLYNCSALINHCSRHTVVLHDIWGEILSQATGGPKNVARKKRGMKNNSSKTMRRNHFDGRFANACARG